MEKEILSVLKHFGWDESFHIPVANEKNKLLECKVEEALKKKQEATSLLTDLTDDLIALKNYHNDIVEQRLQNERINNNYRKQLEEEENVNYEIRFKTRKLIKDTEESSRIKKKFLDENASMQVVCKKLLLKCANIQKNISWCQEIEQYWNECMSEENRDISLLEDYNAKDDVEFKKLELKRVQLLCELNEYEKQFNNKLDMKVSAENNLEKTKKLINCLHKERRWLLDQWKIAARILKARSDGIDEVIKEINMLKEISRNTEKQTMDQKTFYKEQVRNNMEIDMEVRYILRMTYKQQILNEKTLQDLEKNQDKELVKRRELMFLGTAVDKSRISNTITNRKINNLNENIMNVISAKEVLNSKFVSIKDRSISLCDRIKQLENILSNQKKEYNSFLQERQKLTSLVKSNEHKITQIKDQSKIISDELKHVNNLFLKLKKILKQHQSEKRKRTEILAGIKQKVSNVIAEINFMKGEKSTELREETEKRISQLTKNLESQKKVLDRIHHDVNSCNTELKKLSRNINNHTETMNSLHSEKQNLKLLIEAGEKSLEKCTESNKEKQVTENKLRLKASQLENTLSQNNDLVQMLEKQKIDLETTLQERLLDVQSSMNVLKIRKKTLMDEISTLHRSIDKVNNRINQLLKKYEIVTSSLEKDDMGQPLTVSNYKVELVKIRYSLIEKGDNLDEKIRKAEKEIQAMENTLLLVDVTNNSLKKINSPVNENSKEQGDIDKLETEYEELRILIKQKKISIPELKLAIQTMKNNLVDLDETRQQLRKQKKEKEIVAIQIECDLQNQKGKLERVKNRLHSQKSRLKSVKNLTSLERSFYLRELQSINKAALGRITELITDNAALHSQFNSVLSEKGISLPNSAKKIIQ